MKDCTTKSFKKAILCVVGTKIAIIGGSRAYDLLGNGSFGNEVKTILPDTPFGKSSPLHLFENGNFSFYFLSRHGEKNYSVTAPFVNYRANIFALKELGIEKIISWSQPGSINSKIKPGDFTLPNDIIDQTKNRESTFYKNSGYGFIRMSQPFCPSLRKALAGVLESVELEFHHNAVYCCTEGPRLETPAEIAMFKNFGADIVGMTLAPEVFLARELEICYASICLTSNFAEGLQNRSFKEGELFEGLLASDESDKVEESLNFFPKIIKESVEQITSIKQSCQCNLAMERYRKNGRLKGTLLETVKRLNES